MFNTHEKHHLAKMVEELLLALDHPELPKEKPYFRLYVKGTEDWSYGNIVPNWTFDGVLPNTTHWNESGRKLMKDESDET